MSCNVAVASLDSRNVNQGYGHAAKLLVFGVTNRKLSYRGSRELRTSGAEPDLLEARIDETTRAIADCQVLLVSHIQADQASRLNRRGIRTFVAEGRITKAIQHLIDSGKIR